MKASLLTMSTLFLLAMAIFSTNAATANDAVPTIDVTACVEIDEENIAPMPGPAIEETADGECAQYKGVQCYWMENTSGNYCWVPATWADSIGDCFSLDSCDGGMGESGGGCYKWADCSDCNRAPW